jgi:hypothetical protein
MSLKDRGNLWVLLPLALVWLGVSTSTELPGVYMDAVNPDYLVANVLGSRAHPPPEWVIPGNLLLGQLPVMTQVYHGALPFWIGLPFYAILGTDVIGVRMTHGVFASLIVLAAWWMLSSMGVRKSLAAAILGAMAIDPAFQFIFRTQFYITTLPVALLFVSIALMWPVLNRDTERPARRLVLSGVAAGLAVYGYFHFAFFVAVLGLYLWVMRRGRGGFWPWVAGAAIGIAPILVGWVLLSIAAGSLTALGDQAQNLGAFSAADDFLARVERAMRYWDRALTGHGANSMMLDETVALRFGELKAVALLIVPAVVLIASLVTSRSGDGLGLLALVAVVPPMAYGLAFGGRLWVQHFAVVVPVVYCVAVIAWSRLQGWSRWTGASTTASVCIALVLLAVNANSFREVVHRLEITGGSNMLSDAITRFASMARGDDALYITPDWGVAMPLVMLTRGEVRVHVNFSTDRIEQELCRGRDVVVASLGADAAVRSQERAAAVPGRSAAAETLYQRDGTTPVIHVLRWASADADGCPP